MSVDDSICKGICKCIDSPNKPHEPTKMKTIDESYGSLAAGGSLEKVQCPVCNHTSWVQLPD